MVQGRTLWLAAATALCVVAGCHPPPAGPDGESGRWAGTPPPSLGGAALFEQADGIDGVQGTASGVTLARGVAVEDDAAAFGLFDPQAEPGRALRRTASGPADSPYFQPVSQSQWARKTLLVGALSARSARLGFYAVRTGEAVGPLIVQVNGRPLRFDPAVVGEAEGPRWHELTVPVSLLQSGENEVVLRGEGEEASWAVLICPREHLARGAVPRRAASERSYRSEDGGATWRKNRLGGDGSVQGEFAVRLGLDQYVLSGQWTGPVMDLASEIDGGPIHRSVRFAGAVGHIEQEVPPGGRIVWQFRGGPVRTVNSAWSTWQELIVDADGRFQSAEIADRYVQLQAALTTQQPSVSPLIRSVRLDGTEPEVSAAPPGLLRVVEFRNQRVEASAAGFTFDPMPNPRLGVLEQRHGLAQAVRGARTPFETAGKVLGWLGGASRRGLLLPGTSWQVGDILATQAREPTQPLAYQLVLCQALLSQGIVARVVLFAGEGSARSASEFWSTDYDKWVLMDGRTGRYFLDAETAEPLGGLELRDRLLEAQVRWTGPADDGAGDGPAASQLGLRVAGPRGVLGGDEPVEGWAAGLPLLIPRNNFATADRPVPLTPEASGAGWDGYVAWSDSHAPNSRPWIARSVSRRRDFNGSLYRTQMEVRHGKAPGELWISLHTQSPPSTSFQVNVDRTGWKTVPAEFRWMLVPGPNRLEVRARSAAGAVGPSCLMRIEFFPALSVGDEPPMVIGRDWNEGAPARSRVGRPDP